MPVPVHVARPTLLLLATLWLGTGPVAAATSPAPPPVQQLVITSGQPADGLHLGDVITVDASGLLQTRRAVPCELTWDGAEIGTCTADGSGTLTGTLTVPPDGSTGPHVIQGCLIACVLPAAAQSRPSLAANRDRLATANVTVLPRPVIVPPPPPSDDRSGSAVSSTATVAIDPAPRRGLHMRIDGGMALVVGGFALAGISGARLRAHRREEARQRSRRWVRDHLTGRGTTDPSVDARLSDPTNVPAVRVSVRGIADQTDDNDR